MSAKAIRPGSRADLATYLERRGYKRGKNLNPPPAENFADGDTSVEVSVARNPAGRVIVRVTKYAF